MTKVIVGILLSSLALLIILTLSILSLPSLAMATVNVDDSIKMTKQQSFVDAHGKLNIIGVVDNNGKIPISVTVSLETIAKSSGVTRTLTDPTFGNIIYPYTGAPFKFIINPNQQSVKGIAFISSVKKLPVPYYNVIRLDYSNMPAANSSNKALVGTVQNIGPSDLHGVSVYASAHNKNGIQIDSVKSNTINRASCPGFNRFITLLLTESICIPFLSWTEAYTLTSCRLNGPIFWTVPTRALLLLLAAGMLE
jgi:hypothetical protein